jgi:hypothetical protein
MKESSLTLRQSAVAAAVVLLILLLAGTSAAAPAGHATKRRTLKLSGTASLHLVRKSGNQIWESGTATGNLPGTVSAHLTTSVTKVTGTVTFHPYSGGSLTLSAVGYPQSVNTVTRLNGNIAVRKGSGRFKNALGSGTFTGTANRRTWAVTVSAKATITY